jgi:hypothetical protein
MQFIGESIPEVRFIVDGRNSFSVSGSSPDSRAQCAEEG